MGDTDLPLLVPIAALNKFLECTICMSTFDKTMVTCCGHRFCEKCITEWVNRQHKCPCCNQTLVENQLIKDHQFDSLLCTIKSEKEKTESIYFDSLINAVTNENSSNDKRFTAVEMVLKKHLKKSLLEHETYFQSLKKSFQHKMNHLESSMLKVIKDLQTFPLSQQELAQQTQELCNTLERQKQDLHAELAKCGLMVAEVYDQYLTSFIPDLNVLPVKATILHSHASTQISIPDIAFQPTDTLKAVREVVEKTMASRDDPVLSWEPDCKYFIFGPFTKCSQTEIDTVIQTYFISGNLIPDVQLISEGQMLGLQCAMKPCSNIVIHGTVKLESDLPKKCFVDVYKKEDKSQFVDYFSCENCNSKWICRSCMAECHRGHTTVPFIMKNRPSWACCYCPKKKLCSLHTDNT